MGSVSHKCKVGSLEEISVIAKTLISKGFVESNKGQSQKNIPRGEYVIVSLANVIHHRNGEVQYRIAWVEQSSEFACNINSR